MSALEVTKSRLSIKHSGFYFATSFDLATSNVDTEAGRYAVTSFKNSGRSGKIEAIL